MGRQITPLRGLLGLALVVTAILFVIGTSIERSKSHNETAAASSTESASHTATESGASTEAGKDKATTTSHTESTTQHGEKLFGVDLESIPTIVLAAVTSVLLAMLVVWRRERAWLVVVVLFGLVFAVGDARELTHQLNEHRSGLAALAGVLVALHLIVAALAALLIRERNAEPVTAQPSL